MSKNVNKIRVEEELNSMEEDIANSNDEYWLLNVEEEKSDFEEEMSMRDAYFYAYNTPDEYDDPGDHEPEGEFEDDFEDEEDGFDLGLLEPRDGLQNQAEHQPEPVQGIDDLYSDDKQKEIELDLSDLEDDELPM